MKHTIENGLLTVTVESCGAELRSITGRDGTQYLCPDHLLNWGAHAPVLFPNTGAVNGGYMLVDGVSCPFCLHGPEK